MLAKALQGATAAADKLYIESVFQTWLYTGNGSTQTITNGIDLSGEGGMVWIKSRSLPQSHYLFDTERGADKGLTSNDTAAQSAGWTPNWFTSFNSSGFTLGPNGFQLNSSTGTYASWTFRKAEKFFDVVTYTGTGAQRSISHSLGSTPGFVIIKRTDTTGDWHCWHRQFSTSEYIVLNSTAAKTSPGMFALNPDSTQITVGINANVNASGGTYVAYLFAHDAGGFGDSGNESVVKCGSYTGNGSTSGPTVDLGWEPQWILIKGTGPTTSTSNWYVVDTMRGIPTGSSDNILLANTSGAESSSLEQLSVNATGFNITAVSSAVNTSGDTYIYIAIRRGPMKTPTDATKVFNAVIKSVDNTFTSTNHVVDLLIESKRTSVNTTYQHLTLDRLRGINALTTFSTAAEYAGVVGNWFSSNTGFNATNFYAPTTGDYLFWAFRRAPGFFDVVAYTGTGANRTVSHNLGVAPELMIVKKRAGSVLFDWVCYFSSLGNTRGISLNSAGASYVDSTLWNNTSPSSTSFTLGTSGGVNTSSDTYIAYLFASCPGVSKVFNFTGTGTTKQIDCGFTNGARFVMIKRTDSTGDWYVWDSARGIISGNDPYLLLNSTAAEVTNTDYIDPYSAGFEISSTAPAAINANGGSYIGLAIA